MLKSLKEMIAMVGDILTQMGIDDTVWIQLVVFSILFIVLRFLFFGPFLRLIELRESATLGEEAEANELNRKAEEQETGYKEKLSQVRQTARSAHDDLIAAKKTEASGTVAEARSRNKGNIEEARAEIMQESARTLEELKGQVDIISGMFVKKLMKEKVKF